MGSVEKEYLKLDELGKVLYKLTSDFRGMISPTRYYCLIICIYCVNCIAGVNKTRKLRDLKPGQPHLLVVQPEHVLRAALSLYMEDSSLPMPTPEEMLICNQQTTTEEVRH